MCPAKTIPVVSTRQSKHSQRSAVLNHGKHYVEHNYHDHLYDAIVVESFAENNGTQKRRVHRGGVATPFPEKLHFMLSRIDYEGCSDVVSWQPHGRCFIVHKPKEFVERVMPKFFKQTKLTSFQRQLNLYGFARLTSGTDRGGYYHELFIRGRMDLCRRMSRTRVKGNGSKGASSPDTEPNFYTMAPCTETPPSITNDNINTEDNSRFAVIFDECLEQEGTSLHDQTMALSLPFSDDSSGSSVESTPLCSESPLSEIPMVSPLVNGKRMVSPFSSSVPMDRFLIPTELNLADAHSGDKLLFEGLPFHYLETKDVEDSLLFEGVRRQEGPISKRYGNISRKTPV